MRGLKLFKISDGGFLFFLVHTVPRWSHVRFETSSKGRAITGPSNDQIRWDKRSSCCSLERDVFFETMLRVPLTRPRNQTPLVTTFFFQTSGLSISSPILYILFSKSGSNACNLILLFYVLLTDYKITYKISINFKFYNIFI